MKKKKKIKAFDSLSEDLNILPSSLKRQKVFIQNTINLDFKTQSLPFNTSLIPITFEFKNQTPFSQIELPNDKTIWFPLEEETYIPELEKLEKIFEAATYEPNIKRKKLNKILSFKQRKKLEAINYFEVGNKNFNEIGKLIGLSRQNVKKIYDNYKDKAQIFPKKGGKKLKLSQD